MSYSSPICNSEFHASRRTFLRATAGGAGVAWWTNVAERLAWSEERPEARSGAEAGRAASNAVESAAASGVSGRPARSIIMLWLQGGPSQLETFDPHPGTRIGGECQAIKTAVDGVKIASFYPQLAEKMGRVSLVRSIVSKEGDHERATIQGKTGYRPDPTLVHPSLGAVLCHQTADNIEIPRHISIFPGVWGARGGYLGDQFDAFRTGDPVGPVPDISLRVPDARFRQRMDDLTNVVEPAFARGRLRNLDSGRTLHATTLKNAQRMMSSDQLKAFNVGEAAADVRAKFGDTPFGRGCLAAARLVQVGVRCVEVTLAGWDTHVSNHEGCRTQAAILDPAFAALLSYLETEQLLDDTIVLCGGEFGRTPRINPAGGRDHWPHGFTLALAGGGFRGGQVIGATSPEPRGLEKALADDVADPRTVSDVHATVLRRLGIDFQKEHVTPIGRPMAFSDGHPIAGL